MSLNWNFQRGGGFKQKQWIFSGTTQYVPVVLFSLNSFIIIMAILQHLFNLFQGNLDEFV